MQLKLYKRSTLVLLTIIIFIISGMIILYFSRELWASHKEMVILPMIFVMMLASFAFVWYDTNADRKMIEKMVRRKQIALANITNGGFYRIVRNARLKKAVLWKLDITLYDQQMNEITTSFIDKLVPSQTSIPHGHVYVTYDSDKPERIFIIPNAMISLHPDLKDIIDRYESNGNLKIRYLNAYYNDGIVLKTYQQSMKEEHS